MPDSDLVPGNIQRALGHVARDLQHEFAGTFGEENIHELLVDSYLALAISAKVTDWLVLSAELFARQRLRALAEAEVPYGRDLAVLFLCRHNAGRSQMALGFFHHLAQDRALAWSGGPEPVARVNPAVVKAMAEIGIDISHEFPKPWTNEFFAAADVVVTMGCGDSCPLLPRKRYEDWELADPTGKTLEQVRPIRDVIGEKVGRLLKRLGITGP